MTQRSLKLLVPEVAIAVGEGLRRANSKGVAVLVYETRRTNARQAELYARGRTAAGRIVTKAKPGYSWHNYDRAIDAVPLEFFLAYRDRIRHKLDWTPFPSPAARAEFKATGALDLLDPEWAVMVRSFENAGLEWAGRWTRFVEYVHFQMRGGHTLAGLRAIN